MDTRTPSFQTVTATINSQKQRKRSMFYLHVPSGTLDCSLPAGLRASLGVAGPVGLWPGQRCAEIVRVGLVIDGAEDQPRLVA